MKKLVLGVLLTSAVLAARSACTDPPAPKVDWRGGDKRGAQIPDGAKLNGANLSGADLRGASLRFVNFTDAYLTKANLTNVNLVGADLSGSDLSRANLTDANFYHANLSQVVFWRGRDAGEFDWRQPRRCERVGCQMGGWHPTLCGRLHWSLKIGFTPVGQGMGGRFSYRLVEPGL
jgi:hypothetical protein